MEKGWHVIVGVCVVAIELGGKFMSPVLAVSEVRGLVTPAKFKLRYLVVNVSWPNLAVVVEPP